MYFPPPQKTLTALETALRDMPLSEVKFEYRDLLRNRPKSGTVEMEAWHIKYNTFKQRLR